MNDAINEDSRQTREIRTLVADHGFPLAELRQDGDVLVLVPTAVQALPDPETLRALAGAIKKETGHRYVSFEATP